MVGKRQQNLSVIGSRLIPIALLVISLALVIVYAVEGAGGPLHRVQSMASSTTAPLKFVGGAVGSGVESVQTSVENAGASDDTLEGLRSQNELLREQIARLEEYRQESKRLTGLLAMSDKYNFESVTARIINHSMNSWEQVVTIDKGTSDGVTAGLTVMGPAGVVGQVISATSLTADVRLIKDPQSGISVLIQSSRFEGVVRGSLEGLLYLEDFQEDAKIAVGDVVITSGLGGSYNRGLLVGMVVRVDAASDGTIRRVVVEPNTVAGSLEEVLVVTAMDSEGDAAIVETPEEKPTE